MSSTIKVNNIQNLAGDDSGIDLSTNDQIILKTANTTAITVDSSQGVTCSADLTVDTSTLKVDSSNNRVGIGQSSPNTLLHLKADDPTIFLEDNSPDDARGASIHSGAGDLFLRTGDNLDTGSPTVNAEVVLTDGNNIIFRNNASTERMRMDNEGNLLVGGTSDTGFQIVSTATGQHGCLDCVSSSTNGYYALRIDMHANNNYAQLFRQGGSVVGTILISSGSTQYNTSSDYRLKENVTYDFDATTRLKQLRPCRFNFTAYADTTVDGFLAHEVSSIVPEAVSGEKDAVDADGNIEPQGIDQSKLVPLLVKTIQELEARITALESA
tara:strand:+ start:284 stop:1261 length:978 start_codon:yes stop_codon:yes gene_type:complete